MTIVSNSFVCAGCQRPISDLYYLKVGDQLHWHLSCLKCSFCSIQLEQESKCYLLNDGKICCSNDYYRSSLKKDATSLASLAGRKSDLKCQNCQLNIGQDDYIIRLDAASVYHLNCFVCAKCSSVIEPGSQYGVVSLGNGQVRILCSGDYCSQMDRSLANVQRFGNFYFYGFFFLVCSRGQLHFCTVPERLFIYGY